MGPSGGWGLVEGGGLVEGDGGLVNIHLHGGGEGGERQ